MLTVILDTNFLLAPGQFGVDIFMELDRVLDEKYELVVPDYVILELVRIVSKKGAGAKAARIALSLVAKKKIKVEETLAEGDQSLFELASHVEKPAIATLDSALRKRAKKEGIEVIYLRSKKYLRRD
jgi:hypothetical protein